MKSLIQIEITDREEKSNLLNKIFTIENKYDANDDEINETID